VEKASSTSQQLLCPNYVAPQRTQAAAAAAGAGPCPNSTEFQPCSHKKPSDLLATRSVDARGWLRKHITSVVNYGTGIHQNIVSFL